MKRLTLMIIVLTMIISIPFTCYAIKDIDDTYGIEIISPTSDVIYSDYLLISVKVKDDKLFRFTMYVSEEIDDTSDIDFSQITTSGAIETFSDSTNLTEVDNFKVLYGPIKVPSVGEFGFFTIQLENLIPGNYQILIEEVNNNDEVIQAITKTFEVKDKSEMPEDTANPDLFTEKPASSIQVIQDIIKNLFTN